MRIFKVVCFYSALWLIFPHVTTAEEQQPSPETQSIEKLQDVIVSEKKSETASEHVQDVVTAQALEEPAISGSILDTLADQAGVQLKRSTLGGNNTGSLRIRGFGETRLRILSDGVSIQRDGSYGGGQVDWGALSSESVERIEIHRGAGPAKFGNTLGGVVNIVTQEPTEDPETHLTSSIGSLETWDTRVSHSAKVGPAGWTLSASHFETDGYLRNNFSDRQNFNGEVTYDLPGRLQIGAGFGYSNMDTGFAVSNQPDSPYYDSGEPTADAKTIGGPGAMGFLLQGKQWGDESYADDENTAVTAFIAKAYDAGRAKIDFRLWNQERTEYYYDADDSDKRIYQRTTQGEDNNWAIQGEATFLFGDHRIETGGEMRRYGWGDQSVDYIDMDYFNATAINTRAPYVTNGFTGQPDCLTYQALYLQDRWRIHSLLDLEAGLRAERFQADRIDPEAFGFDWSAEATRLDEKNLDPRLAMIYRPWEAATVEARFGVTHRYPNSPEYFWWYLNNQEAYLNTDLKAEEAFQYELSYNQSVFKCIDATVRGYYYDVTDYITSTRLSGSVLSVYYNIGEVDIHGAELGLSAALPFNLRLWGNVTWQEGEKDDDPWDTDNQLTGEIPDLPETMVNLGLDWQPRPELSAKVSLNHVGDRDRISGKELVTDSAYTRVNLSGSYLFLKNTWSRWRVLFSVENLLDEEYAEEDGYPMPGVTAMAGLSVEL